MKRFSLCSTDYTRDYTYRKTLPRDPRDLAPRSSGPPRAHSPTHREAQGAGCGATLTLGIPKGAWGGILSGFTFVTLSPPSDFELSDHTIPFSFTHLFTCTAQPEHASNNGIETLRSHRPGECEAGLHGGNLDMSCPRTTRARCAAPSDSLLSLPLSLTLSTHFHTGAAAKSSRRGKSASCSALRTGGARMYAVGS